MKKYILLFSAIGMIACNSNDPQTDTELQTETLNKQLELIWETPAELKTPESVLFDKELNVLFVSNIDGAPNEKDNSGSIAKVDPTGNIIAVDWAKGLHAPKGMARDNDRLWVSDIDRVVAIDINSGEIVETIEVAGAAFLNDVAVDNNGNVYVTDSQTKKLHKISGGKVEDYVNASEMPNGVLFHNGKLYLLDAGTLYEVKDDKILNKIAEGMESSTDGIEPVNDSEFVVSCWNGVIYYVDKEGNTTMMLDTRSSETKSADIGYDRENKIVYVPTFFKNTVAAYQLK